MSLNKMEETNLSMPSSTTLVLRPQATDSQVIHLKLKKPKNSHKQVSWDEHAIDNEHLNKKKSKCCCIYTKPKKLRDHGEDESSESDHDECDSCMGTKKTHLLHEKEDQKPLEENNYPESS